MANRRISAADRTLVADKLEAYKSVRVSKDPNKRSKHEFLLAVIHSGRARLIYSEQKPAFERGILTGAKPC